MAAHEQALTRKRAFLANTVSALACIKKAEVDAAVRDSRQRHVRIRLDPDVAARPSLTRSVAGLVGPEGFEPPTKRL
jgi:hypothetical protein